MFDKDSDGMLSSFEFSLVIRALGINPLLSEIKELTEVCAPHGKMDFDDFCIAMCLNKRRPDNKNEFLKIFAIFDEENTGRVSATFLKEVLTTLGETLPARECDRLIEMAGIDSAGLIDYKKFTDKLFS